LRQLCTLGTLINSDTFAKCIGTNIIYASTLTNTINLLHRYDTGLKNQNKRIDRLEDILSKSPFLVDGEFTIADVAVASYLLYVIQFFPDVDLHSKWPNIVRYMKECAGREGYGKAFGDRVQSYCVARLMEMESGAGKEKKLFGMF
jgi:glutathionyl-hydroquinone reductase